MNATERNAEWVKRRFGSNHAKPCKIPYVTTCADPACQKADECQAGGPCTIRTSPTDHGPGADAQGEAGKCICKPPMLHDGMGTVFVNPLCPKHGGVAMNAEIMAAKQHLHKIAGVSPTQEYTSPPPQQPDWTPCERTVRHVADMVEAWSRNGLSEEADFILAAAAADIRRTIPKQPDPTEELVEQWLASGPARADLDAVLAASEFAAWLVSKEKLA